MRSPGWRWRLSESGGAAASDAAGAAAIADAHEAMRKMTIFLFYGNDKYGKQYDHVFGDSIISSDINYWDYN